MSSVEYITGAEQLTAVFGHWPSFHDAEVVWLKLDRRGPTVEALVHAFEMTSEVDAAGFYVLRNHVLAHMRFNRVVELTITEFNHQNALMELGLVDIRDRQLENIRWEVHFSGSWGVDAQFQCASVEVASVTPCDKSGNPI